MIFVHVTNVADLLKTFQQQGVLNPPFKTLCCSVVPKDTSIHSEFSNVNHTFVIRHVLGFELRFTQADEFTGTILITLFLLRYIDRMHRAGFSCKVFLPVACKQNSFLLKICSQKFDYDMLAKKGFRKWTKILV